MPAFVARDKAMFAFWQQTHEVLAWALMALIALHVLAALKHHFLDRDDTLTRVLPRKQGLIFFCGSPGRPWWCACSRIELAHFHHRSP